MAQSLSSRPHRHKKPCLAGRQACERSCLSHRHYRREYAHTATAQNGGATQQRHRARRLHDSNVLLLFSLRAVCAFSMVCAQQRVRARKHACARAYVRIKGRARSRAIAARG